MKYLLDASALVELFLKLDAKSLLEILRKSCILDLTIYEFCNALWKLAKIKKLITKDAAIAGAELLEKVIAGKMLEVSSGTAKLRDLMDKALRSGMNIYDSAYIHIADKRKVVLVTEDSGLYTNAKEVFGIEVIRVRELLERELTSGKNHNKGAFM